MEGLKKSHAEKHAIDGSLYLFKRAMHGATIPLRLCHARTQDTKIADVQHKMYGRLVSDRVEVAHCIMVWERCRRLARFKER